MPGICEGDLRSTVRRCYAKTRTAQEAWALPFQNRLSKAVRGVTIMSTPNPKRKLEWHGVEVRIYKGCLVYGATGPPSKLNLVTSPLVHILYINNLSFI